MLSIQCLLITFILCSLVFVRSQNVPNSPCPQIFRYANDGNGLYGIFKIFPPYQANLLVKVKMDIAGILSTENTGKIDMLNKNSAFRFISSGESIEYRITFARSPNAPVITSIEFNGREICSGPRVPTLPRLSIELSHTLRTNVKNPYTGIVKQPNDNRPNSVSNVYSNPTTKVNPSYNQWQQVDPATMFNTQTFQTNPWFQGVFPNSRTPPPTMTTTQYYTTPSSTTTTTTTTTTIRPTTTTRRSSLDNGSAICGMPRKISNELVLRGETTSKGEWPWLSALFLNELGSLNYMCGGSLISRDIVLTAGHCLVRRNYEPIDKERFVVMLGLFNIQDWTSEDSVRTLLDDVIFHPSFQAGVNLRNDIAILRLRTKPTFNDYIIPVCLWTSNLNILTVYGNFGTIVGWGRDENGLMTTPEPRLTRQRVVTTDQCRDSNQDFTSLTSDMTICAGNRNGTGPCNGDSGGGMFFRVSGRWILRGIVSTTLSRPEAPNACNLNDYVVYTDVSKYIGWIYEYLTN